MTTAMRALLVLGFAATCDTSGTTLGAQPSTTSPPFRVEVRDVRIVERKMAVLADPDQGQIQAAVGQEPAVAGRLGVRAGGTRRRAAVDPLDAARPDPRPDACLEPLAERPLVASSTS